MVSLLSQFWGPKQNPDTERIESEKNAIANENDECSICLEQITTDTLETTSCKHRFHKECIKTWLCEHDECPLCRNFIGEDSADDEYDTGDEYEDRGIFFCANCGNLATGYLAAQNNICLNCRAERACIREHARNQLENAIRVTSSPSRYTRPILSTPTRTNAGSSRMRTENSTDEAILRAWRNNITAAGVRRGV